MAHFAGLDEVLDRARDVLDRHVRVHPMLVEEVDDIRPQPLQRRIGNLPDVIRPAVDPTVISGCRIDPETELRRDDHLLAQGREGFADELFVHEGAVDFRRVEERDTTLDGRADQRNRG
jgi:hypothetical protein